jgi:hypothetical protein
MAKIIRTPEGAFFEETAQGRNVISDPRTLQSLFKGAQSYEQVGQLAPNVATPSTSTSSVPITPSPIEEEIPTYKQAESPIERFNLALIELLKKAQTGQKTLATDTTAVQRQVLQEAQQPTTGDLANLTPEQKVAALRSREESYAPSTRAMDVRAKQFEDVIGLVKSTYGDAGLANILPSDDTIQGYISSYRQGMDISSIPSAIRNKVISKLTDDDHNTHDSAKASEAYQLGRMTGVYTDPNTGLPVYYNKGSVVGVTPTQTTPGVTTQPTMTTEGTDQISALNQYYSLATSGITNVGTRQTKNREIAEAINSGDLSRAISSITNAVETTIADRYGATAATAWKGKEEMVKDLTLISDLMADMELKGKDTNLLSGGVNQSLRKLGVEGDSDFVKLQQLSKLVMQKYINAVSGAAFTDQERKIYVEMFPSVFNTNGLNRSTVNSLMYNLNSSRDSYYKTVLGDGFNAIYGNDVVSVIMKEGNVYTKYQVPRSKLNDALASGAVITNK